MSDPIKATEGAAAFSEWINAMLAENRSAEVSDEILQQVMTAAVKAYATKVEKQERDFDPFDKRVVSATEGVTAACAMIRAVDLNMFDVALWFNRPGHARGG